MPPAAGQLSLSEKIEKFIQILHDRKYGSPIEGHLVQLNEWLKNEEPGYWLNLNLFEVLSPSRFIEQARNNYLNSNLVRNLNLLDQIRNFFIFLPVSYTWFELFRATRAYGDLLAQNPNLKNENLLYLWQRGALQNSQPFAPSPFSTMAFIDVVLVALIIVLSIAVHLVRDLWIDQQERDIHFLADTLTAILWEANNLFIKKRRHFFETADERAVELLYGLDNYIIKIQQNQEAFINGAQEATLSALRLAQQKQDEVAKETRGLLEGVKSFVEEQNNQHGQFILALANQQQSWVDKLQEASKAYTHISAEILVRLRETLDRVLLISQQQREQLSQISEYTGSLRIAIEGFQEATENLIPAIEGNNHKLSVHLEKIEHSENRLVDSMQSLEGSIFQVELVTNRLSKDLSDSLKVLNDAYTLQPAWNSSLQEIQDRLNQVGEILQEINWVLKEQSKNQLDVTRVWDQSIQNTEKAFYDLQQNFHLCFQKVMAHCDDEFGKIGEIIQLQNREGAHVSHQIGQSVQELQNILSGEGVSNERGESSE